MSSPPPASGSGREILRLALPAFLALVAEPLFLLADSAIIGHLGTAQLAGLGAAAAALATAASIFVFLAYGTTGVVARRLGAGDEAGAISAGLDGLWLALGLGVAAALITGMFAEPICAAFGISPDALGYGATYLRISAIGLPAMLVILAVTGVLRGLQDTTTPLVASVVGFGANIALNVAFVYGLGMGIAGSAWGTVIAQSGMALGLVAVLVRAAARRQARLRPHPGRILGAAKVGVPLFVRTLALRATLLITTWVAASYGDVSIAAYQVSSTIWTFLVFALDALAIAGQALTGRYLGAGDVAGVRATLATMVRWSIVTGIALGVAVVALSPVLPILFTGDAEVRRALTVALVVVGLGQPVAAYAYVLDGVLIGAGDGRWLAIAQVGLLVAYLPVVAALQLLGPRLIEHGPGAALAAVWIGYLLFMVVRAVVLGLRARTDRWLVTGVIDAEPRRPRQPRDRHTGSGPSSPGPSGSGSTASGSPGPGQQDAGPPHAGSPPPGQQGAGPPGAGAGGGSATASR